MRDTAWRKLTAIITSTELTTQGSAPLVSVAGVCKVFGRTRALTEVSLSASTGESVVLSGANGSGKSTLLKIMATVMTPTSGSAKVCGYSTVSESEAVRRHVGTLFHEPSVYPELTVQENLELFGKLCRLAEFQDRISHAVGSLGLDDHRGSRVRALSHGMRKRVGLALATLHMPTVLLLDEPETGLDVETVDSVAAIIESVCERGGCCIVSSHTADFARLVGTDFYRLSHGRLGRDQMISG